MAIVLNNVTGEILTGEHLLVTPSPDVVAASLASVLTLLGEDARVDSSGSVVLGPGVWDRCNARIDKWLTDNHCGYSLYMGILSIQPKTLLVM